MTAPPPIVITGMGLVSPAGVGTEALATALAKSETFTRALEDAKVSDLPVRAGARARGFEPRDFMSRSESRRLDASGQFLIAACEQAAIESAVLGGRWPLDRVGLFEASSLGGITDALDAHAAFVARRYRAVSPGTLCRAMTGAGGAAFSIRRGIRGPVMALSCGSVSSAAALSVAVSQIESGLIDAAFVVGTEAPISAPVLALFARAGLLSRGADAARACRPFDADRDGTVLAEGAAAIVIERATAAGHALAELAAVAMTSDASDMLAPAADASGQVRAIQGAMLRARVSAGEIDFVSAHGTGTRHNDRLESRALEIVFGDRARSVPISSSKAMLGHCLGASTTQEVVKTVLCMQRDLIPPTLNLERADSECSLDYVPARARHRRIDVALVDNASFGGRNSSVVLRRAPGGWGG
jgi:3-oxoacyl-[acyl-carrier-protein] synthase II